MAARAAPHIVVVGAGFGGLEAAFTVRAALGHAVDITVVSSEPAFVMRPDTIYLPFGASLDEMSMPLDQPLARQRISLVASRADDIDPQAQVLYAGGRELFYDHVVIATGATVRGDDIPGLAEHGCTVWSPPQLQHLRALLLRLRDELRRGATRRVLFVVPARDDWPLPVYELLLMLDTWLRREGVRDRAELRLATHERGVLRDFGQRAHQAIAREMQVRGITCDARSPIRRVAAGAAEFDGAGTLPFDLLICGAAYSASTDFRSLARDSRGFLLVDEDTRRALGWHNVFVVGDAAAFPVKQAVLALLQADVAAEAIVAAIQGRPPRLTYDPTSLLVIDELDSAIFAQVPLHVGDTPRAALTVVDARTPYLVGDSRVWRLGRRVISTYASWRLRSGKPVHGGWAYSGLRHALRVMEAVFTR